MSLIVSSSHHWSLLTLHFRNQSLLFTKLIAVYAFFSISRFVVCTDCADWWWQENHKHFTFPINWHLLRETSVGRPTVFAAPRPGKIWNYAKKIVFVNFLPNIQYMLVFYWQKNHNHIFCHRAIQCPPPPRNHYTYNIIKTSRPLLPRGQTHLFLSENQHASCHDWMPWWQPFAPPL